ncbi:MAG: preprotein translocase subunit SecG [Verrucomicrobiota bacterium]|jgi:preprotein translocase subunit SecG
MSVLGINFLNVSITALVVIYVFVCLSMILLVLMQRPKQEGLGAAFGANATDQLFGARTTNVLQKGTVYMAVLFFLLTFGLAILMQKKNQIVSLAKAPAETEAAPAPADLPVKSLSEELPKDATTPAAAEGEKPTAPATEEKPAGDKPAEVTTPEKPAEEKPAEPAAPEKPAEADKTKEP